MPTRVTPNGQADSRRAALDLAKTLCHLLVKERTGSGPVSMPIIPLPPKRDPDPVLAVFTTGE